MRENAMTTSIWMRAWKVTIIGLLLALFELGLNVNAGHALGRRSQATATSSIMADRTDHLKDSGLSTTDSGEEEHGLSQKPDEIGHLLNFPITNSMLVSWIVAGALIIFAQLATRSMKQVPDGAQNFLEWLVEGLYKFIESIIGPQLTQETFWFFATIFIFILAANWI